MNPIKSFLLIALPVVLFAACTKDTAANAFPADSGLQSGSWRVIGYSGGIGGFVYTRYTGKPFYIQFMANNRYSLITDTSQACGTWKIKDTLQQTLVTTQLAGSMAWTSIAELHHDTLILLPYDIMDGQVSYYKHSTYQATACSAQ